MPYVLKTKGSGNGQQQRKAAVLEIFFEANQLPSPW